MASSEARSCFPPLNWSHKAICDAIAWALTRLAGLLAGLNLMAGGEESLPVQTFANGTQGVLMSLYPLQCLKSQSMVWRAIYWIRSAALCFLRGSGSKARWWEKRRESSLFDSMQSSLWSV